MAKDTTGKPVSAFDLFPQSVKLIRENIKLFAIVYSVPVLMTLLQLFNSGGDTTVDTTTLGNVNAAAVLGVSAGVAAVILVVGGILEVMSLGLELAVVKGVKTDLAKLWELTKKYFFRLIGLGIVVAVVVLVGFLLLIVPGFFMIRNYLLAPYFMVDQDLGIMDSMKKSKEMAQANSGAIWGLIGVTILIAVVPSFLGTIGSVAASLLGIAYSVAPALRYVELKKLG